jgi:hypothetical protein
MSTTTGISVAALLDRASENKRVDLTQTEEQKAKGRVVSHGFSLFGGHYLLLFITQKDENDHQGGASIREQSMRTVGRRTRSSSPDSNSDSNDENVEPRAPPRKRRKVSGQGSADMREMKDLMKANQERRGDFERQVVKALEDSTQVYERTQDKFVNVLMDKLN